ncbi:MAG TPA: hypothetical protein VGI81_07150 [Tepidisphaeraceae bacterium]|jgi:hypothetical protein
MHAYLDGWRWGSNLERARMLLPLVWLVRADATPEHRRWLSQIAADLLKDQAACGAISERLREHGAGFVTAPAIARRPAR